MASFPLVITAAGPQPTAPAVLQAALIALVASAVPGYTATLPGSLVEDVSSTEVYGLSLMDTARVETINSLTTFGANAFLLSELGQLFIGPGAAPAPPTNTSVFVSFTVMDGNSNPVPGYVIPVGFTVSDGTYQYVVQDGGVTGSSGTSPALFCVASVSGSWAIASNTVTQISSTVPSPYVATCANPEPGIPGLAEAETEDQFRARVNQALQAVSTGTPQQLKTLLGQVSGVQQRLISTLQQTGGGWEVIVGGGDPYQVAGAIYAAGLDVSTLVGSVLEITNITKANPGVVTTENNHNYSSGQVVTMSQILGMTPLNSVPVTITVISEKSFSIGIDTSGMPAYISGGICSPVLRNETVTLIDPPDLYGITFVVPPAQVVTITVAWNTTEVNFVSEAAVAQLAAPSIAAYINSITVGSPISLVVLGTTFTTAVSTVLDAGTISELNFSIFINGVATAPIGGSQLVLGDPESYFETDASGSGITVSQG
jgi:Ubiquitin-activating enzyme E1 FCCH domain/Baseplate J-like protein